MAYEKVHEDWRDEPDKTTPVLAEDLEHIEQGIFDAAATADEALALAEAAGSQATESAAGILEIADDEEAAEGVDDEKAMTPAKVKIVADRIDPWAHGHLPRVVWDGSAWPNRADVIPDGYEGAVEYWSPYDVAASDPTDKEDRDLWTRRVAA